MALNVTNASRDEAAKNLAQKHYQIEEGITDIFQITDKVEVEIVHGEKARTEPIKLLEVNQNTVPSGVMPIQFGPNPASGVFYPSVILEVTPEEYVEIKNGKLALPEGWEIGARIPNPETAVVE